MATGSNHVTGNIAKYGNVNAGQKGTQYGIITSLGGADWKWSMTRYNPSTGQTVQLIATSLRSGLDSPQRCWQQLPLLMLP